MSAGAGRSGVSGVRGGNPAYTRYHPRWYRRRMPIFWWLGRFSYTRFILRELTSLFVAYAALLLLALTWAVGQGPEGYQAFLDWLSRPGVRAFHGFVLLALLLHSVTWLNLAPAALVVKIGGRRVPDGVVIAAHYLAWIGASVIVGWALLGRGGG
jgi:fumarate reductase subunit C